ncbi:NADH-ubiquinone oxidoreductase 17.8 kDa subunit [Halenospora varia]|nr:NADH-ubiquinone oxidoreductase 17.8 kDa subunit [Halenospora varia]
MPTALLTNSLSLNPASFQPQSSIVKAFENQLNHNNMIPLRRKAVQAAGRLPAAASLRTRQYSTAQHGKEGDHVQHSAGESTEHGEHEHHAPPQAESLGAGFFVCLAAVPLSIGVYAMSRPDANGKAAGFSRFIDGYSYYQDKWAASNNLHTAAIEQAAYYKNLDRSATGTTHVDLRFPEIFNTGSPYNVVAGQGTRGLDEMVAHYQKLNADEVERKSKIAAEK